MFLIFFFIKKKCSRILLDEKTKESFTRKCRVKILNSFRRMALFKKIIAECKKAKRCFDPKCKSPNGVLKKMIGFPTKIIFLKLKE